MLRSSPSDLVPASPGDAAPTISRLKKTSPPRSARSTIFPADGSFKDRVNVLLPPRTTRNRPNSRQPLGPSRQQGSGTMQGAGLRDRALSGPSQRPPLSLSMPPGYERSAAELATGYQDDRLFDDLYANAVYRGRPLDAPRPPTIGAAHNVGVVVNGARITADILTNPSSVREPLDSLRLPAYGAQRHFGLRADGTSRHTTAIAGPSRAMQPLGTLNQPICETIRNVGNLSHGTPMQIPVVADRSDEYRHRNPMLEVEGQSDPRGLLQQKGFETTHDVGHDCDGVWRQIAGVAGPSSEYGPRSLMLEFERLAGPGADVMELLDPRKQQISETTHNTGLLDDGTSEERCSLGGSSSLMQPLGPWFGRFGDGKLGEVDTFGGSSDRQAPVAREEPAGILSALEAYHTEEAVKFRRSTVHLNDCNAHSSRLQQPASGASENTGLDDDELMRARGLVGSPRTEAKLIGLTFESGSSSPFQEVVDSLPLHEKGLRISLEPKLPEASACSSHPKPSEQENDCPQEADMESPYKPVYPAAEHRTQLWVDRGGNIEILRDRRGRPRQGTEIGWGDRNMQDLLQQALKTPVRKNFVTLQSGPQLGTGSTSAKALFVDRRDLGNDEEQAGSGLYSSVVQNGEMLTGDEVAAVVCDSIVTSSAGSNGRPKRGQPGIDPKYGTGEYFMSPPGGTTLENQRFALEPLVNSVDGVNVLVVMDRGDPQASVQYSSTVTKKSDTRFSKSSFSDKKSKTLTKTRNNLSVADMKKSAKASSARSSVGPSLLDTEPKEASRRRLPPSPIDTTKTELNLKNSSVSQPTQSSLRKQLLPQPSMSGRKYNPRASVGGLASQLRAPATIAVTKDGEQETARIGDINSAFFYSKLWPGQNIPPSMNDARGSLFRSMQPLARNEGYLNMRGIAPRQAFIQDFGQKWAQEYDEFVKHWEIVEAEYGKPNAMVADALLDQPPPLPEDPVHVVKKSHTQNIVSGFKKSLGKSGLSNLAKMPSSMHLPLNHASGSRSTSGPAALEQSKKSGSRPLSPCEIFNTENFKLPEEEEKNVYIAMSKIYWLGRFNTLNTNRMNEELAMKRMTGLAVKYSTKSQNGSDANHARFDELWDQEEIDRAIDVFEEMWQRCKTVEARRALKDYKIHFARVKKVHALLPEGVPMEVPVVRGMAAVAGRMLGTGDGGYREMQLQRREQREVDRVLAAIKSKNPGPSRLPVVTGGERKWPWLKKENRRSSEQNL